MVKVGGSRVEDVKRVIRGGCSTEGGDSGSGRGRQEAVEEAVAMMHDGSVGGGVGDG